MVGTIGWGTEGRPAAAASHARGAVPGRQRPASWRKALACVGLLLALMRPDLAAAHAVLLRGEPAPGGILQAGHIHIDLQFNSRIEHAASQVQVQRADDEPQKLVLTESPTDVLRADAELGPGPYTLRWQVLAVDGHLTRGIIPFTVGKEAGPSVAVSTAP